MSMDEHTEACLRAMLEKKQMQRMLASAWHDCTMGEALEWLGKDFMRGHIRIKPQVMCELAGAQYPPPMSEALNYGNDYYVASPHPQADILRRIADGEDLKDRLWHLVAVNGPWVRCDSTLLLSDQNWTFAISDKPGTPPPLPRKMIQLRPGGPKYPQGETVAPGNDVIVWIARLHRKEADNSARWGSWVGRVQSEMLRLGLVHLSEANYKLYMAALEDLMLWAHEGGVK